MANVDAILTPVAADDACGPDLRWDGDFLALADAFSAAASRGAAAVVDGQALASGETEFDEVIEKAVALCSRTKDVRVLALYAEASWYHGGLVAFAEAMEAIARAQETWPDGTDGIHPRADEVDGDLGERVAALGKLVNGIPRLAATIGWGGHASDADMLRSATTLRGVFGAWSGRFEVAFGPELPSCADAWRALGGLIGAVSGTDAGEDDAVSESGSRLAKDAWDLIDQALERMIEQDHHSPALPLLRLLSTWRSLGIIDIVERMKASGVTLEQLMESVKRQTQQD